MSRAAKTVKAKVRNWGHTTKVVTRLQVNDLISPVTCVGLDWEGHGLVQLAVRRTQQDFPVSLPRVLPDESVVLKVTKAQRTDRFVRNAPYKAAFELHGTNMSSIYEVPPRCDAFVNRCGGCTFQHLDYGKQVAEKQRLLDELFSETKVSNVIPSPTWAYRSRMEFNFLRSPDTGFPALSMQRHRLIIPLPVSACPVLPPRAEACMKSFARALEPYGSLLQAYDARTARGVLHRAVFKTAEVQFDENDKTEEEEEEEEEVLERVLLHVTVTEATHEVRDALFSAAHSVGIDRVCVDEVGVSVSSDSKEDAPMHMSTKLSPHAHVQKRHPLEMASEDENAPFFHHVRWKNDHGSKSKCTTKLIVAPRVFFQPNLRLLPRMIELVTSFISRRVAPRSIVWDLFSGPGTIGIPLAQMGFHVHCFDATLRGLRENIEANTPKGGGGCPNGGSCMKNKNKSNTSDGLHNGGLLTIRGWEVDLSVRLDLTAWGSAPLPAAIVVDPPRDGCPIKLRRWLKSSDVPYIVYVSCNPLTMSRDVKYLAEGGYRIEHLVPLDFYPHVSHVEVVALLVKDPDFVKEEEKDEPKDDE